MDFHYNGGKKYAPNCANCVLKYKTSPEKGVLTPGPPPAATPWTPLNTLCKRFGAANAAQALSTTPLIAVGSVHDHV